MKSAVSQKRIREVFQLLKVNNEFFWNGYLVRRNPGWRGNASFGYWPVTITKKEPERNTIISDTGLVASTGSDPSVWTGTINEAIKALHFTMNRKGFIQNDE